MDGLYRVRLASQTEIQQLVRPKHVTVLFCCVLQSTIAGPVLFCLYIISRWSITRLILMHLMNSCTVSGILMLLTFVLCLVHQVLV
jgi:hypothetical protein